MPRPFERLRGPIGADRPRPFSGLRPDGEGPLKKIVNALTGQKPESAAAPRRPRAGEQKARPPEPERELLVSRSTSRKTVMLVTVVTMSSLAPGAPDPESIRENVWPGRPR